MSLVINAPAVERKLHQVAQQKGVKAEEYAAQVLAEHLEPLDTLPADGSFAATAPAEEWTAAFNTWVNSHPRRTPLPEDAFDRASFYEDRS